MNQNKHKPPSAIEHDDDDATVRTVPKAAEDESDPSKTEIETARLLRTREP